MKLKKFIPTPDLIEYKLKVKLLQCPHCRRTGTLISHGHQYGYCEDGCRGKRRWRVLCKRRTGCGKTSSTLIGRLLSYHTVSASWLWSFATGLLSGLNPQASWDNTSRSFSLQSAYRLYNKLKASESYLRILLLSKGEAPSTHSKKSLVQTLSHLRSLFPVSECPIASFQWLFQKALFPP